MSKKKPNGETASLRIYSPKVLASIDPIGDHALASRCLPVRMQQAPESVGLLDWDNLGERIHQRIQTIRQGGYALGLYHHRSIQREYRRLPVSIKLPSGYTVSSRKRELVAPLLSVARLIDYTGETDNESAVLEYLDHVWNSEHIIRVAREKLLATLLRTWAGDPDFNAYQIKDEKLYVDNQCWSQTPLAVELGGQPQVLKWLKTFDRVDNRTVYLSGIGQTKSCTVFPLNLKISKTTVGEIFSQKTGS